MVTRVGKTNSVGHNGISAWNAHSGTFRDFLYDSNLVENTLQNLTGGIKALPQFLEETIDEVQEFKKGKSVMLLGEAKLDTIFEFLLVPFT